MVNDLLPPPVTPAIGLPSPAERLESLSDLDVRQDDPEGRAAVPDLQQSGASIGNIDDFDQLGSVRRFIGSQNRVITQLGSQLDLAREINADSLFDTAFVNNLLGDSPFSAEDALITDSQNSLVPTVSELLEGVISPQQFLLDNQSLLAPAEQEGNVQTLTDRADAFGLRAAETVIRNANIGFNAEFELLGLEPNLNLAQARESINVLNSDSVRPFGGSLLPPPADLVSDFFEL